MRGEAEVRAALAARTGTNPEEWHLVFRARHGMLAVLRAWAELRVGDAEGGAEPAGTAYTQLFTCCTAVDPFIEAGYQLVYGDLDPATLALGIPLEAVPNLSVVVDQHSFGIIDDEASLRLRQLADASDQALLLEDSAHCACRFARDEQGAPIADVSVHSFGVGKVATSDFGGAVWVNPRLGATGEALARALDELPAFDRHLELACRSYGTSIRILMHLPRPVRRALWDTLAKARLFVPAVSSDERRGMVSYEPQRIDGFALENMVRGIESLDREEERSLKACEVFLEAFVPLADELGIPLAARRPAPLLYFPLVLPNAALADGLIEALCAGGCYCEAWGRPLLYPGVLDEAAYQMPSTMEQLPETARISQGVVPLLTCVSPDDALKAAGIVVDYLYGRS